MGKRRLERFKMVLPVRVTVYGAPPQSSPQLAYTLDISRRGARLAGVRDLPIGARIILEYKRNKGTFEVVWVGAPGTKSHDQVGVRALQETCIWIDLPGGPFVDRYAGTTTIVMAMETSLVEQKEVGNSSEQCTNVQTSNSAMNTRPMLNAAVAPDTHGSASAIDARESAPPDGTALQVLQQQHLSVTGIMHKLLERERLIGAALAVCEGRQMVCVASSGIAPRVGVQFAISAGLSGQALRENRNIICNDVDITREVARDVCREHGIRSAMIVPLRTRRGQAVLEVFGSSPSAFVPPTTRVIEEAAEVVSRLL